MARDIVQTSADQIRGQSAGTKQEETQPEKVTDEGLAADAG